MPPAGGSPDPASGSLTNGDYPVGLTLEPDQPRNRWWAFPILGGLTKLVGLIPHFIVLFLLAILFSPTFSFRTGNLNGSGVQVAFAGLAFLVLWVPVFFGERFPAWGYALVGGFLRWSTRLGAFLFGLTDVYPPFSMRTADHPLEVTFQIPARNNRWWAFPVLCFYVKQLILIPHYLCLIGLGVAMLALWLTMWIPVLLAGRYPPGACSFAGGVFRWILRVNAFQAGLTDRYPPFSLS